MVPQIAEWTCSACALDWVMRAAIIEPNYDRIWAVLEIGYPANINPQYGLMDASGGALMDVYAAHGQQTRHAYLNFDQVYAAVQRTTGQMSGGAWYHWVALRGVLGDDLWIANSAPGYKGVWDILSREDFNRLGPFSVVLLD